MMDDGYDIVFVSNNERLWCWVFLYELVEDGDGVLSVRADEERDSDEQAQWVVGELFLDKPEVWGGERWERDAGDETGWTFRRIGFRRRVCILGFGIWCLRRRYQC